MEPSRPDPVLLVVAAFSRHDSALAWAHNRLAELHGPVALASPCFEFHQTRYYEPTMGPGLRKQLIAFERLIGPDLLASIKLETNALERELVGTHPEPRPINLDPGVLSLGKFLLATTKDQQHRIYLREGIYAEVTLRFTNGAFEPWPWTYADYQQTGVLSFLKAAREFYWQKLRGGERSLGPPGHGKGRPFIG